MILHFCGVRSTADFSNGFFKEELLTVDNVKVYSQKFSQDYGVNEPCIWIPANGQYDVWQLRNETIVKDTECFENLKSLCESLVKKLYSQGFVNGDFKI